MPFSFFIARHYNKKYTGRRNSKFGNFKIGKKEQSIKKKSFTYSFGEYLLIACSTQMITTLKKLTNKWELSNMWIIKYIKEGNRAL